MPPALLNSAGAVHVGAAALTAHFVETTRLQRIAAGMCGHLNFEIERSILADAHWPGDAEPPGLRRV